MELELWRVVYFSRKTTVRSIVVKIRTIRVHVLKPSGTCFSFQPKVNPGCNIFLLMSASLFVCVSFRITVGVVSCNIDYKQ